MRQRRDERDEHKCFVSLCEHLLSSPFDVSLMYGRFLFSLGLEIRSLSRHHYFSHLIFIATDAMGRNCLYIVYKYKCVTVRPKRWQEYTLRDCIDCDVVWGVLQPQRKCHALTFPICMRRTTLQNVSFRFVFCIANASMLQVMQFQCGTFTCGFIRVIPLIY